MNGLLEHLTQEAIEAARVGKWDLVIDLHERRLSEFKTLQSNSPALIESLVKSDTWLIARVREAQLALQQNISDIQDQRRKLDILKRQYGLNPAAGSRHLMTI